MPVACCTCGCVGVRLASGGGVGGVGARDDEPAVHVADVRRRRAAAARWRRHARAGRAGGRAGPAPAARAWTRAAARRTCRSSARRTPRRAAALGLEGPDGEARGRVRLRHHAERRRRVEARGRVGVGDEAERLIDVVDAQREVRRHALERGELGQEASDRARRARACRRRPRPRACAPSTRTASTTRPDRQAARPTRCRRHSRAAAAARRAARRRRRRARRRRRRARRRPSAPRATSVPSTRVECVGNAGMFRKVLCGLNVMSVSIAAIAIQFSRSPGFLSSF